MCGGRRRAGNPRLLDPPRTRTLHPKRHSCLSLQLEPLRVPDTGFYYHAFNRIFGENGNGLEWGMRQYLLIIDEAQLAYSYTPIWNDLMK